MSDKELIRDVCNSGVELEAPLRIWGLTTLRDYFAGQALAHLADWPEPDGDDDVNTIARVCYELADAMLQARAK